MLAPKFPLNFSVWYLVISQKVCSNDTRAVDQTHRMTVSAWYLGSESIMAGRQRSFTLLCMYTALSKGDISSIPELGRSPGEGIGYLLQYSWASLVAETVKNLPAMWETWFNPWVGKIPWRRAWPPTRVLVPGESLWTEEPGGSRELDMTERLRTAQHSI